MSPDSNNSENDTDSESGGGFLRDTLAPILVVIAIVVPLRSAIADWNDVPSGSMRPTILEGDRIWVNKLAYGLRVPLTMSWIARWEEPNRGDVVTFASPDDGIRLVKRIVGVPGDRLSMRNNRLSLNGRELDYVDYLEYMNDLSKVDGDVDGDGDGDSDGDSDGANDGDVDDDESTASLPAPRPRDQDTPIIVRIEELDDHPHAVTVMPTLAGYADTFREFTVPEGHYFFLGDNRDQSRDSRFIGTVALDEIYGRVTHVALSLDPDQYYKPRFSRWLKPLDPVVNE